MLKIGTATSRLCRTAINLVAMVLMIGAFGTLHAQVVSGDDTDKGIDVVEHLGDTIPLDLTFTDDHGKEVVLSQYFGQGKPVILTLAYSNCPMLCSVILDGLTNGVRELEWRPGDEFQMITVSIDPLETVELTSARKHRYLQSIGPMSDDHGWAFLVSPENHAKPLADALGFIYYYDKENKQYAHPAVTFVLTEDGVISRYLYGIKYKKQDLKLALLEASQGKIGNTIDRIILYCFHYDPDAKGYVVFAGNVMRLGGVITVILLALFLGILWARDRVRRRSRSEPA
jgi:protein SCO1/2